MTIEHKSLTFEVKADPESRRITGYGAVFGNKDSVNDIIIAGAFAKSIGRRQVKMLYQHESDDLLGFWDVVREDSNGLYIEGNIAKTSLGNDVYELAKIGALNSMSIGYSVDECEYDKEGVRVLKSIDLWEVSLVTFPANEKAVVTGVKSAPKTIREFEDFLREAGKYSREDATTIALHGFKALPSGTREAEREDTEQAAKMLADFFNNIKNL
jgi:HK97 family phage prohead protease